MDRRRFFVAALASVACAPRDGVAQAPTSASASGIRRIGFLGAADPSGFATRIAALRAGLRDHGYVEGRNLGIEFRRADGRYDLLPALAQRLPAIGFNEFAEAGGLLGYGVDFLALHRGAAAFVDRILKGAKPADLPVVQPAKFSLVVNRETARLLGLTLPASLLARAEAVS